MSRHRDVRSMNYSDEYDGYDDIYGHSVEDDYCVSPSAEQFLFDRSKQQNIASFIMEPDIVEDNEEIEDSVASSDQKTELTEPEKSKLMTCIESIRNVIGDTLPEAKLKEKIIKSGFNVKVALDEILEELSPKDQPALNVEKEEPCLDVSVQKSNTFTIPKLLFKKQDDKPITTRSCIGHIKGLGNVACNNPSVAFPSLADMIANHKKSISSPMSESPEVISNAKSFNSLADLAADHLQKTGSPLNNPKTEQKNFVIPKLSSKKHCFPFPANLNETNMSSKIVPNTESRDTVDTLENALSNVRIHTKPTAVQPQTQAVNVAGDISAPSPDNWMIDLSTALKEAEELNQCSSVKMPRPLSEIHCDIPILNVYATDSENGSGSGLVYTDIKCVLNLHGLKNVKFPHAKKSASLFGKTLCRHWRLRKPVIKSQTPQYQIIKQFDFSVAYTRS